MLALYDLAKKASVRENAVLPVLLLTTSFGAAAFILALSASGNFAKTFAAIDARVVILGLSKSAIVGTSWIFTFCALRTLPITIATPIRASAPALVFVVALFLYGEIPTWVQGIGMVSVFLGYWVFSWAGKHEGIDFLKNHAVWFAIAGACFSAISSIWDKFVFQKCNAPIEPVQLLFQIGLVFVYAIVLLCQRGLRLHHDRFEWRWTIPFVGILLAGADWLYFKGLAIPEVPISVASLMRRFSVAITFVLGAICFRETNLKRKLIALVMIIVGISLLCVHT